LAYIGRIGRIILIPNEVAILAMNNITNADTLIHCTPNSIERKKMNITLAREYRQANHGGRLYGTYDEAGTYRYPANRHERPDKRKGLFLQGFQDFCSILRIDEIFKIGMGSDHIVDFLKAQVIMLLGGYKIIQGLSQIDEPYSAFPLLGFFPKLVKRQQLDPGYLYCLFTISDAFDNFNPKNRREPHGWNRGKEI
jgi:hypothetical protein